MALEKQILEFPFEKGIEQKVAQEVAPDGLIDTIENADLSKVGTYVKRKGYTAMTTATLGPSAGTFGNVLKLASREQQLIAISSNAGGLGSGAGSGSSGDTIFSYSDELVGWKAHSKIQRPTAVSLYSFSQDSSQMYTADVAKGGDIALIAFRRLSGGKVQGGIYVHIIDISSDTVVTDAYPLQYDGYPVETAGSVKCVCRGNLHYVFWIAAGAGGLSGRTVLWYSVYDRTNHAAGLSAPATIVSYVADDVIEFDITSTVSQMFVAWLTAAGEVNLKSFTLGSPLVAVATCAITGAGTAVKSVACSINTGKAHVVYLATGRITVNMATVDTALMTIDASGAPITGGAEKTMVLVASLAAGEAWVFSWESDVTPPVLRWIRVSPVNPVTLSGGERVCINVKPTLRPFFSNSRLYIGVAGYDSAATYGTNYGHCLAEIDVAATTAGVAAYTTLMPAAAWANDLAQPWFPPTSCPNGSSDTSATLYTASGVIFRSFDIFRSVTTTSVAGASQTYIESGFRLMALALFDSKKWQTARHGESILFSGGIPYCFDGLHAHEAGFIWRPRILSWNRNTGVAVLPLNTTLTYMVTYEYWDSIHRRWQSVPNLQTEAQVPSGTDTASVDLVIRAPTVTAMPRGGSNFFGLIRISIWRSVSSSPDEFKFLGSIDTEPFTTVNYTWNDVQTEATIAGAERLYTYGGELENYCPPPCRSLASHRDRVFAINSETNELWYTKPLINRRGVEWSRYQKIPLFEKGMALASLESALLIFTNKGIYALQGSGPSITGMPPDAFSKLYQVSGEVGCIEVNAAFRTPVGVIFRGRQGLWMVDKAMGLKYIGGSVERFMSDVTEMLAGDIDEGKACVRFLVRKTSTYYVLNYWYDTNRWSYDTCASDTINASVVHQGTYYQNRAAVGVGNTLGVWKGSTTSWSDVADFYGMKVRTHWLRFGNMSRVKRVWRVLFPILGREQSSLRVRFEKNFSALFAQTETFTWSTDFSASNNSKVQPRVHLAAQKVTALRVTMEEQVEAGNTDSEGLEFMGLSFELGLKHGAVKMRQELSK